MSYDLSNRIKIFYIKTERRNGFVTRIKKYIHPEDSFLCAKFRNLKSEQVFANKQAENETDSEFIVNRRAIRKDMYIEYNRKTFGLCIYEITGIDPWDDSSEFLKISTKQVNSKLTYDKVEGTEFN